MILRLFPILLIASVASLFGCSQSAAPLDDFGPLPEFHLIERSGQPLALQDLAGKTWIAAFVFTRCAGPCTHISGSMARLQSELKDLPNVRLVSFTVDPEFDTPAVLTKYAERFQADPQRWLFATGEPKAIHSLLREGFKVGVEPTQGAERRPGNEVTHSTKIVLMDRRSHLRGYFDGLDPHALDELVKQARQLEREKP